MQNNVFTNRVLLAFLTSLLGLSNAFSYEKADLVGCGAECLYVSLASLGVLPENQQFKSFCDSLPKPTKEGFSLSDLYDKTQKMGLECSLRNLTYDELISQIPSKRVIIHCNGDHFMLVKDRNGGGVEVFDPQNKNHSIASHDLEKIWTGESLVIENPNEHNGNSNFALLKLLVPLGLIVAIIVFLRKLKLSRGS